MLRVFSHSEDYNHSIVKEFNFVHIFLYFFVYNNRVDNPTQNF
jgi:hypothetical protein